MNKFELVQWLIELENNNEMWRFYKCKEWLELRDKVLQEFHNECAFCRSKGKISKATTVHHHFHVKDRKDLALSEWVIDEEGNKIRNLIPLCDYCHLFEAHPEKLEKMQRAREEKRKKKDINEERW